MRLRGSILRFLGTTGLARRLRHMGMAAVLGGLASTLVAAGPAYAEDDLVHLRQPVFKIPVQVAPNKARLIKELRLFVSTDLGQTWQMIETADPSRKSFTFRSQEDGEYWFSLVYVDRKGRAEPENVEREAPGLRVVVDTQAPRVRLDSLAERDGKIGVAWKVDDEKIDLESLKLEIRGAHETSWRELTVPKMIDGERHWMADTGAPYQVRATIRDRAGNETVEEATIAVAANYPVEKPADPGLRRVAANQRESMPTSDAYRVPAAPPSARLRTEHSATTSNAPVFDRTRYDLPADEKPMREVPRMSDYVTAAETPRDQYVSQASHLVPVASTKPKVQQASAVEPQPQPKPVEKPKPAPKRIPLLNTQSCAIDYALRGVGPAGIGKVELYYTKDNGQSWKLYGEDKDRTPPFEVVLPDEGRYGIRVVVTSRAGYGQAPPKPGDAPQSILEVDTTPPEAELFQPTPDPQSRTDSLLISWAARDKHLGEKPVSLYFAEYPEGPWYAIKTELNPTGQYSWRVPANIPYQVYLRLMVTDMCENVSVADTPDAVLVDLSRPEADVIGIATLPSAAPTR
ncbi:Ser-Thr-rich glycosyl-phosphatidyl-inositol-anchored membrane family protein [Planctomycetes bacterium Pan216]|uniref:Ser-Thr-rich glycosyl-phosphatidyl-inositol-anchored membrane family protein n=1 Tax=Kolteria novifilia TaxID=2527975 RepID=A0A518BCH2_9BACT|nr:Ser-Thr-rich glycosyl-phosphatidyl-inositol-anchored membrane family protein [Planctomycetes bacterium Pan216]